MAFTTDIINTLYPTHSSRISPLKLDRLYPPFFFTHSEELSLVDVLRASHRLFVENGDAGTVELSINRAMQDYPDFALSITTLSAYRDCTASSITEHLITRFSIPQKQMHIATCLQEALVNSIVHGNLGIDSEFTSAGSFDDYCRLIESYLAEPQWSQKRIEITAWKKPDHLIVSIHDQGSGLYVLQNMLDHALPHGRGLLFIHSFADDVWISDNGRKLFMRFQE